MNILSITHSADADGWMSRRVIENAFDKADVNLSCVEWDYGQEMPVELQNWDAWHQVWLADICIDDFFEKINEMVVSVISPNTPPDQMKHQLDILQAFVTKVIWCDHHESSLVKWRTLLAAIKRLTGQAVQGFRKVGIGACRLTWFYTQFLTSRGLDYQQVDEWFESNVNCGDLNKLKSVLILERVMGIPRWVCVVEPASVYIVGLRDVFQHKNTALEQTAIWYNLYLTFARTSLPRDVFQQDTWLQDMDALKTLACAQGERIDQVMTNTLRKAVGAAYLNKFEGVDFVMCNAPFYTSALFEAAPDCAKEYWQANKVCCFLVWSVVVDQPGKQLAIKVSLYKSDWAPAELTLLPIATAYGGGGHAGACGFRLPATPEAFAKLVYPEQA